MNLAASQDLSYLPLGPNANGRYAVITDARREVRVGMSPRPSAYSPSASAPLPTCLTDLLNPRPRHTHFPSCKSDT